MAVLGRLLVSSAERLDLPDLLSLDSYAAGDWKYFLKGVVGSDKPYILKGFDVIDPANAIGTQSCAIRVADSLTFYPGSSAGAFFHGLEEGNPNAQPLVPELRKNAVNYVYLTLSTFNTSVDTRAFWDPDKDGGVVGGEFTQDVNTESVLRADVNVSTGSFPANTIPIAKITVGPVVITDIEDARDMMFRLGSGGISPNPFNNYGWRSLPSSGYARQEPPTKMTAGGVNPFQGADKNIHSLKEWMDAVMSKLRELGGTTYWYDDASSFSLINNFYDAVATAFKSKGKWIHDTSTAGLLTWTEDAQIKMTSDPRTYIIRQGSKTLADEQVMWVDMQRNELFNAADESVQWVSGFPYINTVGGAIGLFANLAKGDYVKKVNDTIDKWVRVEEFYDAVNLGGSVTSAANARSVRLGDAYLGSTAIEKGRFDKGVYLPADLQVTDRSAAGIAASGGNFHWLAMRSDTIENIGNAVTTTLAIDIDEHDGFTARVTSPGHGLSDGDRVTIGGTTNFNGTYQVEVETPDIFYINISGGPFADESGSAFYAVITTAARSTPYGFQEESANHGFNSNDTVIIAGTTDYNGSFQVNVRDNVTFQIAMPAAAGTETTGTATLARIIVRNEGGVSELIQGQAVDIGGSAADNIRQYIGMQSLSETAPSYAIAPDYNTLDGMANYNGVINENLTARISKLTAMMADKAQDKTIKFLLSNGAQYATNSTNGAAQELRIMPDGMSITVATPSSNGQTFFALPGSATPVSLQQNQAAWVQIDRNTPSVVSINISNITSVPLEENVFVVALRINTQDIYLWDGTTVQVGKTPLPSFNPTIVQQNQSLKLVEGGFWSWSLGTQTLTWDANAFIQVAGLANSVNSISTGSITLTPGQIAYVDINRSAPGGTLTVTSALNASTPPGADRFIIARRETNDVIVGLGSMRLMDGESRKLYAGGSGGGFVKVNYIDPISTSLPTGVSVTIDGSAGVNGDLVLFTNLSSGNNRIYKLGGVGTSITWTPDPKFNGLADPTSGDSVIAMAGTAFQNQIAIFDGTNFYVNDKVRFFDGVSADFWELSSIKTMDISNNVTEDIFSVSVNGSENMIVSYSIIRGSGKQTGQLFITSTGVAADISDQHSGIGDPGINFAAVISGGDIVLRYTSTNTGATGILKYFVKRWSDSAGGPSGIPDYHTGSGGGGGGAAAGNLNEVQYNGPGNLLTAESRFKWNPSDGALELGGQQQVFMGASTTVNNNQAAPQTITSFSATSYRHAVVEYSIVRNGEYRTGRLMVAVGSTAAFSDDFVHTNDVGVTLSANLSLGTVSIQYVSTNTGFAGTCKLAVRRWI